MKKKELENIREKSITELKKTALEAKKEISLVYTKIKAGQEKNTSQMKKLRHNLAQVLTLIREKEIMAKEEK